MPHSNRLAAEKSPYLLQHAGNPVDWYPWGDEAFARARAEDRPVFLSVGYATCHWCHVMERESFEDPEVAELLNRAFVCVKVDREERPDVDQVYMTVCQMLTGSGGWPLTVIMTPDRRPFFAATYLPKRSAWGRVGLTDLVPRVEAAWAGRRGELVAGAEEIVAHLRASVGATTGSPEVHPAVVERGVRELAGRFDADHGGFGSAPKFPAAHQLLLLLGQWRRSGDGRLLDMVERTLAAMRRGGIFDQVGFGFHRYSTDREWLVPHFEKMLYDQAMLTLACTEAWRATGRAEHERTVRQVVAYVERDLTSPAGAFYSAEDADSEGEEGKFYLWTIDEVRRLLGPDLSPPIEALWNLRTEGNFHDEASGRRTGANIPHRQEPLVDACRRLGLDSDRVEQARRRLLSARSRRVRPLLDDKVLADWNGLMAAAMARAGRVLDEPGWVAAAERAVEFVLSAVRDANGRLLHRWREGDAAVPAFLDDHAFLTWALLELYDATFEPRHLERALTLSGEALARFWDDAGGGFFLTPADGEELLVRPKEAHDGAIPSGNSVTMGNLLRLAGLTGRADLAARAHGLAAAFARDLERLPSAHAHMLEALALASGPHVGVVVAGGPSSPDTARLVEVVRTEAPPGTALVLVPPGEAGEAVRRLVPFAAACAPVDGQAAAYLCRDFACQLPVTDPEQLAEMLQTPPDRAPDRAGGGAES